MIDFILKKFYMFSDFSIDKNENYYIIHRNNMDYYLYHFLSSDLIVKAYHLSLNTYNNFSYIYNIFHDYITYYNHDYYVLISIKHNNFFDYTIPLVPISYHFKLSWYEEWIQTSSFFSNLYYENQNKNHFIDESIFYYLGMLEYAIYYVKDLNLSFYSFTQQKVFTIDNTNPFNYIEDVGERDFSEYLKYLFLTNKYKLSDIFTLLHKVNHYFNYNLIVARLLYPNYYFREVQSIISNNKSDSNLKMIVSRVHEYEEFVIKIVNEINRFYPIKKYPF